ncbi:MAG TPA: hypothetical protein VKB76_17730 [Ktedonobacterales bacterium]|nr:hypothetical protein [Ktedonobacterales bacterium]
MPLIARHPEALEGITAEVATQSVVDVADNAALEAAIRAAERNTASCSAISSSSVLGNWRRSSLPQRICVRDLVVMPTTSSFS